MPPAADGPCDRRYGPRSTRVARNITPDAESTVRVVADGLVGAPQPMRALTQMSSGLCARIGRRNRLPVDVHVLAVVLHREPLLGVSLGALGEVIPEAEFRTDQDGDAAERAMRIVADGLVGQRVDDNRVAAQGAREIAPDAAAPCG